MKGRPRTPRPPIMQVRPKAVSVLNISAYRMLGGSGPVVLYKRDGKWKIEKVEYPKDAVVGMVHQYGPGSGPPRICIKGIIGVGRYRLVPDPIADNVFTIEKGIE